MLNLKIKSILIYFLFYFFTSNRLLAQDPFRNKINSVFQNVDKSQVPTKFLMEYGCPFVPMNAFNGNLADSVKTDITMWRMAYASYLTSHVDASSISVPLLRIMNQKINATDSINNAISVPLLFVNYNDLRPDALTSVFQNKNGDYFIGGYSNSIDGDFNENAGFYFITYKIENQILTKKIVKM